LAEEKGLTRAQAVYRNRRRSAEELKAAGKKVIGYLCAYPPLEMMTTLDIVPFRLLGDINEPISKADGCLPTVVCPFIRSTLDLGLKQRYEFLDGVVMAHSCDVAEKTAHIWNIYLNPDYFHFIDTPHTASPSAVAQHRDLLAAFGKTLEELVGKKITAQGFKEAIELHNQQRALVRRLYDFRKPDPPLVSGVETLQVMVALMSLSVIEGNELLHEVIAEVGQRRSCQPSKKARLLVWGSILDNASLIGMMEGLDASLVMDDTCVGSRFFWPDVELTDDPLDGLARRYLVDVKCPRTFRQANNDGKTKDYRADLEARFGYLKEYARDWNVQGVVLQSLRYCDIHGYEVPQVKDYFKSLGLPCIYIEHDYHQTAMAPLKTRIQAFLEIIDRS
jgi:bzd-type benzoyl-CoA reductase N subunit